MKINNKTKNIASDTLVAREISQEILSFGVSQFQIKKIIEFLAFELENNDQMRNILRIVRDEVEKVDTVISEEKQKENKPSLII